MSHIHSKAYQLSLPSFLLTALWVLVAFFLGAYVWLTYSSIHLTAQRAVWETQQEVIASETAQLEERYLAFESGATSRAQTLGLASAQDRIRFVERRNALAQRAASLSY